MTSQWCQLAAASATCAWTHSTPATWLQVSDRLKGPHRRGSTVKEGGPAAPGNRAHQGGREQLPPPAYHVAPAALALLCGRGLFEVGRASFDSWRTALCHRVGTAPGLMAWDLHGPRQRARLLAMAPHRACQHLGRLLLLLASLGQVWMATTCPEGCKCDHLLVNCTQGRLGFFPMGIPLDTRQLVLVENQLDSLPSVPLNILTDLVYLDCSNNELSNNLQATFFSLPLVYLDLSFNNLTSITLSTFNLLTSLVVLKLSDNPFLAAIEKDSFSNNTALRELDLSRTALTFLDATTVNHLINLRTLDLSANLWHCDCSMRALCSWLHHSDVYLPDAENMTCNTPPEAHGILVPEMEATLNVICFTNLYQKDYAFLMLIGFVIFSMGTVVAWVAGICIVLYNRFCKSDDDDEDYAEDEEPRGQPPARNSAKDKEFEVYVNAYV
ncbi:leucine-rich repeat-containing protein 52 [Ambystoma mexicanum]|uniref:leucine-rich repeat-containing protein 52 n=1 Tax=Ambystoma mexicanum TaxID=8296 RepID=UPI0037E9A754